MNDAPKAAPALEALHSRLCYITEQFGESLNRCETVLNRIGVFRSPEPTACTGQQAGSDTLLDNLSIQVDRLQSLALSANDLAQRLAALG